jgi:signal transduction histidine kinase
MVVEPVRARCERLAAQVVHRPAQSPYEVLAQFSSEVGTESPEQMPAVVARMLVQGIGVAWAQVWVLVHGEPTLVATYPSDARAHADPPVPYDAAPPGDVRSVTVVSTGRPLGVLRVGMRPHRALTVVEERLLAGLAAQAGLVLQTAQLRAELAARLDDLTLQEERLRLARDQLVTAQDQERRRLERDIHDGAQQQLVALAINLKLAGTLWCADRAQAVTVVEEQLPAVSEAIRTLTDLSQGLLPQTLSAGGVGSALRSSTKDNPVPVHLTETSAPCRLRDDVEAALYFSALEAIQNATKHADAARIEVKLDRTADGLTLTIADDGVGLTADAGTGTGMASMRDRIAAVGGTLSIRSRSGRGTEVTVTVPADVPAATAEA